MADQKLTERDEVTDSNSEDIIHVVKDGVSYKQTKANFLNGISSLIDVSALWSTGLTFNVTADSYQVNGKSYSSTAGQVTLDTADATLDRIDLIVAIAPVLPATVGTVGKITGVPASVTVVAPPDYDPSLVFPIKQVTVKAAATEPYQVFNEVVFNEGVEWTPTYPATFSLVTDEAALGLKSIYANNAGFSDELKFVSTSSFNAEDLDILDFRFKADLSAVSYINLQVAVYYNGFLKGYKAFKFITESSFKSGEEWATIIVTKEQLGLSSGLYNEVRFKPTSTNGVTFWIDGITLRGGSGSDAVNLNISQFINDVPYAKLTDLTGSDYSEWATYTGTRVGNNLLTILGDYDISADGTRIEINDSTTKINNFGYTTSSQGFGVQSLGHVFSGSILSDNITSSTTVQLPDASGTIVLEADASGFNGNLTPSDTTLQAVAQKFDDYIATVDGYVTLAGDNIFTGINTFVEEVSFLNDISLNSSIISELSNGIDPTDAVNKGQLDAATPYQTPTQLLTAIKTVDGTGSGLDADFIDGLDSSRFIRSDAGDTATGDLTFNGATLFEGDINIANADGIEMTGRQITGLQDGVLSTDAVNKSQLDAEINAVTNPNVAGSSGIGSRTLNWGTTEIVKYGISASGNMTFSDTNLPAAGTYQKKEIYITGNTGSTATFPTYWQQEENGESLSFPSLNRVTITCLNSFASSEEIYYRIDRIKAI